MNTQDMYILVRWPDSQDLMHEHWFREECFLANSEHLPEEIGSSAYFVPLKRLLEVLKDSSESLFDAELKRLIWEEWESEIKENDPREMVFKYMKKIKALYES